MLKFFNLKFPPLRMLVINRLVRTVVLAKVDLQDNSTNVCAPLVSPVNTANTQVGKITIILLLMQLIKCFI